MKQTLARLLSIPLAGISMQAVASGVADQRPWLLAALSLFSASMMFCWTSVFHEAAHQTLGTSPRFSLWTGRILGTFMFTPYHVYREVHIRHHAYLNRPQDWELWPYSDPHASLAFRRFFAWFDLVCGVVAGPMIYGRMFFHPASPIKSPELRRTIRHEYLAVVVAWSAIWAFVTWRGEWREHALAVLLPMVLAAIMQTGRKFTEHLGMASFDPLLGTRTVVPAHWMTRLSAFFNFDIFVHGPHHRHPRLAHALLEDKLVEYQNAQPDLPIPAFNRYWRATLAMLPFLVRNPGCGVNAGADADASPNEFPFEAEDVPAIVNDVS